MQYCDYDYYKNKYYGNVIAEADFPRLIDRASTKLDVFTFNRLSVEDGEIFADITYATHVAHELLDIRYADKVRKCVCAIADYLMDAETAKVSMREQGGAIVASVSSGSESISFRELIETYLFLGWKHRGTCITVDEYIARVHANILNNHHYLSEEEIINSIEVMENFILLYYENYDELTRDYGMKYYDDLDYIFIDLLDTLEKRMGLTTRKHKDRIVVYPKNVPLEKVIELAEDEEVQWELIKYAREDLSLSEKRKSLAYLATNLYIEDDKKEQNEQIKNLLKESCNILNNLHIRHNNKTGKWENKALQGITKEEATALCDMVFNEMLTIVLMREHKQYEPVYRAFKDKQKSVSDNSRN